MKFQVAPAHIRELELVANSVEATVTENSHQKALAILSKVPAGDVVIAADTLVALGEKILTKPTSPTEALEGLKALAGKEHRVLTGLTLAIGGGEIRRTCTTTRVWFRKITDGELLAYCNTPEPYDKAGGYGIQGLGSLFVERIEGSYSNVIGLPIETLVRELAALTGIDLYSWFPR